MYKSYHHLGSEQRYRIESFMKAGFTQKQIAVQLGVHPSTISRELKRNTPKRGCLGGIYDASNAQRRTEIRHKTKAKRCVFDDRMKQVIKGYLEREKFIHQAVHEPG